MKKTSEKLLQTVSKPSVFRLAVQGAFDHIIITDIDGRIVYANPAVERITGYAPKEVIGNTPRLWGGLMPKPFYVKMWQTIKVKEKPFAGEIKNRRKDGREYMARSVISPIHDEKGRLIGFFGTEEDITAQKDLERLKTEFVNLASHQLRAPLTAMAWNLEELRESTLTKPQQKKSIDSIESINKRLIDLVNALLAIGRIESGRLAVKPVNAKLGTLLAQAAKESREYAAGRKTAIVIRNKADNDDMRADPSLLVTLFSNLLSNAIKYSPKKSTVHVVIEGNGKTLTVSIIDQGCGIPKAEQKRIFEKFFRASNVSNMEGNGLGLYLVKSLVTIARGTISFTSTKTGTTFTVTLPRTGPKPFRGSIGLKPAAVT